MNYARLVSMHFPDRRESVHGGCGKNFLFFTLRETRTDQPRSATATHCRPRLATRYVCMDEPRTVSRPR
jgi:hypothetical protein